MKEVFLKARVVWPSILTVDMNSTVNLVKLTIILKKTPSWTDWCGDCFNFFVWFLLFGDLDHENCITLGSDYSDGCASETHEIIEGRCHTHSYNPTVESSSSAWAWWHDN